MRVHVVDAHDDRVRHLTFLRRATVTMCIADDDRAVAEAEL
jgi:hypothetical protein